MRPVGPRGLIDLLEELLDVVRGLGDRERPWSEADLLTEAEVVARLRRRTAEGRVWLNDNVAPRMVAGEPRWIWGDVLAALRGEGATFRRQPAPKVKLPSAGTWPRG